MLSTVLAPVSKYAVLAVVVVDVPKVLISGVGAVGRPRGEEKQREQPGRRGKRGKLGAQRRNTYTGLEVEDGEGRGDEGREREGEEGKNEVMEAPGAAFCSKNRGCW